MINYAILTILGLLVGSFLNVCIWRIPRGKSIVLPPSSCPSCGIKIMPYDNIPVLSYVFLWGRCRRCGGKIPVRYPIVEALNAALYVLVYGTYGMGYYLPVYLAFTSSLIVITFIDIDFQIIPDSISLPWIGLGLICSQFMPDPFMKLSVLGFKSSLLGALVGFLLFFLVAVISRGGMGGGDIKLMSAAGAITGWKGIILTTFIGSLTGSVYGLYLIIFKGKGRKAKVPFGPFLALGAAISMLFGQEIIRWYMRT